MFTPMTDRSVIVTGASKGIGNGIARVFGEAGAQVLVVSRNQVEADAAAQEIVAAGGKASGFAADIATLEGATAMAEAAAERHSGIDVLCANAGTYPQTKLEEMDVEEWDSVMATNLRGNFVCVKACTPYLKKSDYGRIVLTSSITGPNTGYPGWTHYGASKSGQLGFMRSACMELAKYGITVNAVLPGNTLTDSLRALGEDYLAGMAKTVPVGRLGEVEDMGHAALFLASKEAGYINGHSLVVDGGQIVPESQEALDEA